MAASIQPYTTARISYLATYLQSLLPGLNNQVATQWITAEKGVNGNVLGTTYNDASGQHLFTYPSQEAGLQAAANWINTGARYSGVKASLSSGSASAQATALSVSGWNNSYYPGVFANLIGGSPTPAPTGGASTPQTVVASQTNPGSTAPTGVVAGTLSATFSQLKPTYPLDQTTINLLMGEVPVDNTNRTDILAGLTKAIGTPINQVKMPTNWNVTPTGGWQNFWGGQAGTSGSGGGLGNSGIGPNIPDVQTAITFLAIILVGIAFIGVGGLIALRKK